MKVRFLFLFIVLFMLTTLHVKSQATFGVKGGLNFAHVTYKQGTTTTKFTSKTGIHAGFFGIIPVAGNISFEPALLYTAKGGKYSSTDPSDPTGVILNYMELPLNITYNLKLNSNENIKPIIFAGPYAAYAMSAKVKYTNSTEKLKIGNSSNSDLKPLDFGVNIGAGVKISNIVLSMQYGIGLSNISSASATPGKNGVFGLSFGYLLNKKE